MSGDITLDIVVERLNRIERAIETAYDAHRNLHTAHDHAHDTEHEQTAAALLRAEMTMRETAELHAVAHEREHRLATEALDKAEHAAEFRYEQLKSRFDALDRALIAVTERQAAGAGSAARIEALEKSDVAGASRDSGVRLVWIVLVTVIGIALTALGLYLR